MKDHYRILLLPLKFPKLKEAVTSPFITTTVPLPFLFIHLSKSLTRVNNPSTGLNRRGALTRFLNWGEVKWQEYSEASPRSFKGVIHRIGSSLLDKIPVSEKQLWRFHTLHQHFRDVGEGKVKVKALEIETGSIYLTNPNIEQSLKFDLISQFNNWASYHRRWSIFSTCLILPVAILSILPFGKLFLAWIIFRAVAHWRAFQGAHFLLRCFNYERQDNISDISPIKLISNNILDKHLPLPPNFTSETAAFNDPFLNLSRDLDLGELSHVLPKVLKEICKKEEEELKSNNRNGMKRRKFSNQNLLEP
jgi:hypothetical protein